MSDDTALPMSEERLAEIKAAAGRERWATYCGHIGPRTMVTELLAEVDRLRQENAQLYGHLTAEMSISKEAAARLEEALARLAEIGPERES